MQLDAALIWTELKERDLSNSVVVVADILRATTVMTTALSHGAKVILPQESDQNARNLYTVLMEQGAPVLLCGEKEGFKREGYDYGNSPLEFTELVVKDKTLIQLTTNGTRALVASSPAKETIIVSFANISAVAEKLRNLDDSVESVIGVVSGREGRYCLEDMVCIGGVLSMLLEPPGHDYQISDAARSAVDLYHLYQDCLPDMIRQCFHGRFLQDIGLGDDLPECVRIDTTDIVPVMKDGRVMAS